MTRCWVYENWTLKKAILHLPECGYCNNGEGIHADKSDKNSKWHAFNTLDDGMAFVRTSGYENARTCKSCLDYRIADGGLWKNQSFTIAHADNGPFVGGLRAFFEYRDLGIKDATKGKYGAHVIRAVPGMESPGGWHTHDLDFQMVYVTKGWVVFEYEGQGEHMLREGSCVLQPPGIRHREVRHSDDMELIEIISPAEFPTAEASAP